MSKLTWAPTAAGRRWAKAEDWRVSLDGDELTVVLTGTPYTSHIRDLLEIDRKRHFIWSTVELTFPLGRIALDGIPNRTARDMVDVLSQATESYQEATRLAQLVAAFDERLAAVAAWADSCAVAMSNQLAAKGWVTRELVDILSARRPSDLDTFLVDPDLADRLRAQTVSTQKAIQLWTQGIKARAAELNEAHVQQTLRDDADFFNIIERSPLTEEQARAVLCFDNRVQVIASAGSGKTSVMVAKAAYAIRRNLIQPERILMLAFNNKAAVDLREKLVDRLTPLGLPADRISAQTFHAFGLEVIGRATGKKPSLAPWLESGELEQVGRIVDELRDESASFRGRWDLFRLVFGRDVPEFGAEEPEDWDLVGNKGFRALRGEIVRSKGERQIADWLYYNGVNYEYEKPYEHETADALHSQYRPDFYYPDIATYHEHFALDENGVPPAEFVGYADGVAWKREIHKTLGTNLIETTMAGVWSGDAFEHLETELTARGIALDPNPDRPIADFSPVDNEQLIRKFRMFLVHAKSNQLTDADLQERLESSPSRHRFRHSMFLQLFASIRDRWEQKLRESHCIDFEDMLNLAADHIESGRLRTPFELVMVDEMQDASHARARLAKALVAQPGRHLFAVGDDWQSINRFAGADLSVMTEFERWFGEGEILRLQRTFRSPQSLCDVSSAFVQKNPTQLSKVVHSTTPEFVPTFSAVSMANERESSAVIRAYLDALNSTIETGSVPPGRNGKAAVFVLGRYRRDEQYMPASKSGWKHLDVEFRTVHSSKGAEADYIVLPGLIAGTHGFPNTIADDPVLQLAMPHGDTYPVAEERRLFYVALTRARRGVYMLTVKNRESPFLMELVAEHGITMKTVRGVEATAVLCPVCGKGRLVSKKGKYGDFVSCTEYPRCNGKVKTAAVPSGVGN